jgi:translation elongation factor aEF-1 beta
MGSYIVRIKILPTGPEVPSQKLLEAVKAKMTTEMSVRSSKEEPIAFGLYSLTVDVVAPEVEGMVDKVEEAVAKATDVGQSELIGVSRMSSTLKV